MLYLTVLTPVVSNDELTATGAPFQPVAQETKATAALPRYLPLAIYSHDEFLLHAPYRAIAALTISLSVVAAPAEVDALSVKPVKRNFIAGRLLTTSFTTTCGLVFRLSAQLAGYNVLPACSVLILDFLY